MYFSEQGNVDDDATFIRILLVSFNLQSCCLKQSAVCSLQMSYTAKLVGEPFGVPSIPAGVLRPPSWSPEYI